MGSIWMPIDNAQLEEVNASTIVQIKDIPVGSIVVDKTWTFQRRNGDNYSTPNTVNENIEWMVVDTNSHFKQAHYGNTSMSDHVTLLTNKIIAKYYFNTNGCYSYGCSSPWVDMPIRNTFLRDIFYNAISTDFKNHLVNTTTKTSQSATQTSQTVSNETIFLLSATEFGFTHNFLKGSDGVAIPFFNTIGSRSATGEQNYYWTRSPTSDVSYDMWYVQSSGALSPSDRSFRPHYGVRPTVNIKAETLVRSTGTTKTNSAGQNVQIYEIVYNQPPTLSLTSPSNNRDILMI